MADGTESPTTPNATPPAAVATQPAPVDTVTMTRAELDAMIKDRADSAAAAARRAEQEKRKPAETPTTRTESTPTQQPSATDVAALVHQAVSREAAFGEAVREHGLNSAQASTLRKLMQVDNPPDAVAVTAWVKEQAAVFGKTATTPNPNAAQAAQGTPNVATPAVPAPISPSAPSTAVPLERDVDILTMDAESVHELMRKKGAVDPSRPYDPKNRAARREIRVQFESAVRNRRIVLGSQK